MNEQLQAATIQGLKQIRLVLSDPARWCKGTSAKRADGLRVVPYSPEAYAWCLAGIVGRLPPAICDAAMAELMVTAGGEWLPDYNDAEDRTHAEVVALIDETIVRLEGRCPEPTKDPEASTPSESRTERTSSTPEPSGEVPTY